jgi:polyphosphate kinase
MVTKASHPSDLGMDLDRPELYINRELSAVAFVRRVLNEADPERYPLLECVRFLGIVSTLYDDFVMVRLAGLLDQVVAQVNEAGPDGMLPGEQIAAVRPMLIDILHEQERRWREVVQPRLAEVGISVLNYEQLNRYQQTAVAAHFRDEVFPVLTPLGVDLGHPFPHISNKSLNLAVVVRDPTHGDLFARLKVPSTLRRLVPVPLSARERTRTSRGSTHHQFAFVPLEQVIAAHLDQLFPGLQIVASYPFRVLRDTDFEIQQDEAGDLLETIEQGVRQRRFGSVVNLCVRADMPDALRTMLCSYLGVEPDLIFSLEGPLGLDGFSELLDVDRPDLKDKPLLPNEPPELRHGRDPFEAIKRGDLLLHHPYDAFSSVADFIKAAARDPHVLAIKQTLYRVGVDSPIVRALLEANDRGKQVAVLVELKARGDEAHNIGWARTLESAGVHVVYGQVDLKTHAKVALVVRREGDTLRRYVHLGTGNYNASTARVYEDFALLTCRTDLGEDASNLFNALTGYARDVSYKKLLVGPDTLRPGLVSRIEREIQRHRVTGKGRLIFKTNSLVDPEVVRSLYRASRAGVQVDLIVRGICCLRPGVAGVSEHIRVRSIIGRFLEHSRIYYFANGGEDEDELYLGSADLMPRNLDHRIEVVFPVEDPTLRGYLRDTVLPQYLRDNVNASILLPSGEYERVKQSGSERALNVHTWFAGHAGPRVAESKPVLVRAPIRPVPQ